MHAVEGRSHGQRLSTAGNDLGLGFFAYAKVGGEIALRQASALDQRPRRSDGKNINADCFILEKVLGDAQLLRVLVRYRQRGVGGWEAMGVDHSGDVSGILGMLQGHVAISALL